MESDVEEVEVFDSAVDFEEFSVQAVDKASHYQRQGMMSGLKIHSPRTITMDDEPLLVTAKSPSKPKSPAKQQNSTSPNSPRRLKFSCQICERVFYAVNDLVQHVRFCKGGKGSDTTLPNVINHVDEVKKSEGHSRWTPSPKPEMQKIICPICQKVFKYNRHMADHMKTHKSTMIECTKCKNKYTNASKLATHYKVCKEMTEMPKYPCNKCGNKFYHGSAAQRHKAFCDAKSATKLHTCNICSKAFQQEENLKAHMYVHQSAKPTFSCRLCGNTYRQQELLDEHYRECLEKGGTPNFFCVVCGNRFHEEETLAKHFEICKREMSSSTPPAVSPKRKVVTPVEVTNCTCERCGEVFERKHNLLSHEKDCDGGMLCVICGKSYPMKIFKIHEKGCLGVAGTEYESLLSNNEEGILCVGCGNTFPLSIFTKHERQCLGIENDDDSNETHSAAQSDTEKEYKCDICAQSFDYLTSLEKHKLSHTNTRTFSCYKCENKFKYEGDMKKHFEECRKMKGLPQFACQCGNKFYSEIKMKNHSTRCTYKTVVQEEVLLKNSEIDFVNFTIKEIDEILTSSNTDKERTCPICSKVVPRRKMEGHMRTHSTARLFKCRKCGNQYKYVGELNRHYGMCKQMMGQPKFICRKCGNKFYNEKTLNGHEATCKYYKRVTKKDANNVKDTQSVLEDNDKDENFDADPLHMEIVNHECIICSKVIKYRRNIEGHMLTHNNTQSTSKLFSCPKCGNRYEKLHHMQKHYDYRCKITPGLPHVVCKKCGNKFYTKMGLVTHNHSCKNLLRKIKLEDNLDEKFEDTTMDGSTTPSVNSEINYDERNEETDDTFNSANTNVTNHEKNEDNSSRPYACSKCGNKYKTAKETWGHNRECVKNEGLPNFACEKCGNKYYREYKLLVHTRKCTYEYPQDKLKNNLDENPNDNKFEDVEAAQDSDFSYDDHDESSDPSYGNESQSNVENHECPICHKIIKKKKNITSHMRLHSTPRQFKCEKCGNKYKQSSARDNHWKYCRTIKENPQYACNTCGNKFYEEKVLKCHIKLCVFDNPTAEIPSTSVSKGKGIFKRLIPHNKKFAGNRRMGMRKVKMLKTFVYKDVGEKSFKYECSICSEQFDVQSVFVSHVATHNCPRPYKCMKCGNQYKFYDTLRSHKMTCFSQRDPPKYACVTCGNKFYYTGALKAHIKNCTPITSEPPSEQCSTESSEATYNCDKCGNTYKTNAAIESHKEMCGKMNSTPELECNICGKKFYTKYSLSGHKANCRSNPEVLYKCPYCTEVFQFKSHIDDHITVHGLDRPFVCGKCGNKYSKLTTLESHEKKCRLTVGMPTFACERCENKFHAEPFLNIHLATCSYKISKRNEEILTNTDVQEESKDLDVRSDSANLDVHSDSANLDVRSDSADLDARSDSPDLDIHSETADSLKSKRDSTEINEEALLNIEPQNDKVYSCSICPSHFNYKSEFQRHMESHSSKVYFACENCGNQYKKSGFSRHVNMCKKAQIDPKVMCGFCGNKYGEIGQLNRHMHSCKFENDKIKGPMHLKFEKEDGQFLCPICSKKFSEKWIVKAHMRKHNFAQPYICVACGKKYRRSEELNLHIQKCVVMPSEFNFICNSCGNKYDTEVALTAHLSFCGNTTPSIKKEIEDPEIELNDAEIKRYKCTICDQFFNYKSKLDRHMSEHDSLETFTCAKCGNVYQKESDLKRHLVSCRQMKNLPLFPCKICGNKFHWKRSVDKHIIKCKRANMKTIVTNGESETTETPETQEKETESQETKTQETETQDTVPETQEKNYKCTYCDKSFNFKSQLENHLIIDELKAENTFECAKCGNIYKTRKNLKKHTLLCMQEMKLPHINCNKCGNKFYSKYGYYAHSHTCKNSDEQDGESSTSTTADQEASGNKIKSLKCPICFKEMLYERSFRDHMKTHGEPSEICEKCGNKYHKKDTLNKHLSICLRMTNQPKLLCGTCGNKYYNPYALRSHKLYCIKLYKYMGKDGPVVIANKKSEEFNCSICSMEFTKLSLLRAHMNVHTDANRFKCSNCGNVFKQLEELNSHRKLCMDMEIEPKYECDNCGNKYQTLGSLEMHVGMCIKKLRSNRRAKTPDNVEKIESSEHNLGDTEIYKCRICNKQFTDIKKGFLTRHMKSHFKTVQLLCAKCKNKFKHQKEYIAHRRYCLSMDGMPQHSCRCCGNKFYKKSMLKYHFMKCSKATKQQKKNNTDKSMHVESSTTETVNAVAEKEKALFACAKCGIPQNSLQALLLHMRSCRDKTKPKYACLSCGRRFHLKLMLMTHKRMCKKERMQQNAKTLTSLTLTSNYETAIKVERMDTTEDDCETNGTFSSEIPEQDFMEEAMDVEEQKPDISVLQENLAKSTTVSEQDDFLGINDIYTITELPSITENFKALTQIPEDSPDEVTTDLPTTPQQTTSEQPQYFINVANVNNLFTINISTTPITPATQKDSTTSIPPVTQQTDNQLNNIQSEDLLAMESLDSSTTSEDNKDWFKSIKIPPKMPDLHVLKQKSPATYNPSIKCKYCKKKFTSKSDVEDHQKTCIMEKNEVLYQCTKCTEKFQRMDIYKDHLASCRVSDASASSSTSSITHQQCDICKKFFREKSHLEQHIKIVHTMTDRSYSCEKCGNKYRWKNTLISHEKVCHKATGMPEFKCMTCLNRYYSMHNFKEHEQICKRANVNANTRQNSLEDGEITRSTSEHFQCRFCYKIFPQYATFKNHMDTIHGIGASIKCILCEKIYTSEDDFLQHQKLCKEKKTCVKCDTKFNYHLDLVAHMKTCSKKPKIPDLLPIQKKPVVNVESGPSTPGETEHYQIITEDLNEDEDGNDRAVSYEIVMEEDTN